ncbi:hypothetical protein Tco_1438257 [Tanacetum coccineum]
MGETVRPLPLACEWEEIPEAFKAHIYPTLEKVEEGHCEDLIETWRKGHSKYEAKQRARERVVKKQVMEAHMAYLASLKARSGEPTANVAYKILSRLWIALAQRPHYTLLTNPHMNDSRSCDQLAQDLAREKNNECSSGEEEEEEGEQQSGDDYSSEEEE